MHMQRIVTQIDERILSTIDLALWDLVGTIMEQPVNNILGLYRDKVPAYASTMCGDTIKGGLSTPEEYGNFAEWCVKEKIKVYDFGIFTVDGEPNMGLGRFKENFGASGIFRDTFQIIF